MDVNWTYDYADYVRIIAESDCDVVHVNCDLYSFWPVLAAKDAGKKVVANIHDLSCARREDALYDVYERAALEAADAHIWVTPLQRDFAISKGFDIADKPWTHVLNFASRSVFIDKPLLPSIGGVVYAGGLSKRGDDTGRRDLSRIADALDGELHIYPGNTGVDYGIVYESEHDYPLYIEKIARHQWGFSGHPELNEAWAQTFATKVGEYWAAGLPFISLNVPFMQEYADRGLGICIDSLDDLKRLPDPKPYRKCVLAQRDTLTTQSFAPQLGDLFRSV